MGQQEIHEHEALGGGFGRRLYGNVSRLVEELQVRRAKTPTISDRCLGFSLNIAWQNLNGQVTF